MKTFSCTIFFLLLVSFAGFSQTEVEKDGKKVSDKEAKEIISQLKIDTARFLASSAAEACKCIDSITLNKKSAAEISQDIFSCIDKHVTTYQLLLKINASMLGGSNKIELATDKNSNEYKRYYFEMERWLKDSCASLKNAVASDNKESEFSKSKDEKALEYYYKGVDFINVDNYKDALPWFEKAVKQDDKFAFAWDNIGVSKRKLGDLDGALAAYLKSLQLDPKGKLPLQNIPVVYEFKKDYEKALDAYKNILTVYPDDPEAYYGSARMYAMKDDIEKALDNMCKAYNIYTQLSSPYRVDAENNINYFFKKLKETGKEELFYKVLKDNNIKSQ